MIACLRTSKTVWDNIGNNKGGTDGRRGLMTSREDTDGDTVERTNSHKRKQRVCI